MPTERPRRISRVLLCGAGDAFVHLVNCYGVKEHLGTGLESVKLMVRMVGVTVPPNLDFKVPKYIVLAESAASFKFYFLLSLIDSPNINSTVRVEHLSHLIVTPPPLFSRKISYISLP